MAEAAIFDPRDRHPYTSHYRRPDPIKPNRDHYNLLASKTPLSKVEPTLLKVVAPCDLKQRPLQRLMGEMEKPKPKKNFSPKLSTVDEAAEEEAGAASMENENVRRRAHSRWSQDWK